MFLKIFRNISFRKFFSSRVACNNVASFCHGRATSQETIFSPQCVLIFQGFRAFMLCHEHGFLGEISLLGLDAKVKQ